MDSDSEFGRIVESGRNRNRIHQAAVKQLSTAIFEGREDQRGRDRGADRVEQLALAQPHFLARLAVGCDSRERYREILDGEFANEPAQCAHHSIALETPGAPFSPNTPFILQPVTSAL